MLDDAQCRAIAEACLAKNLRIAAQNKKLTPQMLATLFAQQAFAGTEDQMEALTALLCADILK